MKKIMLIIAALICINIPANSQLQKTQASKKFFLTAAAGPSFPVGDFASKNISNEQAGFAKTGFNINLNFGYQQTENFGFVASLLYSKHLMDVSSLQSMGLPAITADHWQSYGIMVGPMLTLPVNDKIKTDFKILAGVTNVNAPVMGYAGDVVMSEQWSAAFAMQLAVDMRYYVSNNFFLIANIDYNAMRPKFKITDANGNSSGSATQQVSDLPVTVGIGVAF
jgi:hypothetical protein